MSEAILQSSTHQRLEPFLILAKSVKGVANVKLIQDVLAAPGVYVFAELLESPNMIEASTLPEVIPYYTLLNIFSYGTYRDFVDHATDLPPLNEQQTTKLKHLSIVSLSEESRTISYDKLLSYLDIADVRNLEDLIIGAFYENIMKGKMDQKRKQLEVEYTMGRDLRPGQRGNVIKILQDWSQNTDNILTSLDQKLTAIHETAAEEKRRREQYDREIERLKKEIKSSAAMDVEEDTVRGKGRRTNSGMYDDGETLGLYDQHSPAYHSKEYVEESYRAARTRKSRGSKRYMIHRP